METAADLLHDNFVQEWPQSGERIEGPRTRLEIDRNFPGGLPRCVPRDRPATGELAVLEVELTYADGSIYQGVSIVEVRDGKVEKETDYFAQPFKAPQWRAQWVSGSERGPRRGRPR